jgi:hypothetical protein
MQTGFDPSVPPKWLASIRGVVYFAAKYWWCIVPSVLVLARIFGLQWRDACLLAVVVLIAIAAGPFALGGLIALVSRARRQRSEDHR